MSARDLGQQQGWSHLVRSADVRSALMYSHRSPQTRVDVVDLDPYGTAAPFVDAAVGCIADGGQSIPTPTVTKRSYPQVCSRSHVRMPPSLLARSTLRNRQ